MLKLSELIMVILGLTGLDKNLNFTVACPLGKIVRELFKDLYQVIVLVITYLPISLITTV